MTASRLILVDAFVQVNTIRGYRYLDDAGSIMVHYDAQFPDMKVGLEGLQMTNPDATIRQIHVSTQRIWIHYNEPDTLTYITDQSRGIVETISEMLAVDKFSRVALRLQELYPADDNPSFAAVVRHKVFSDTLNDAVVTSPNDRDSAFEFMVRLSADNLTVALRVAPVRRDREDGERSHLPHRGILIDSDIFREGELSLLEYRRFLRDAVSWAKESLPVIADTFLPGR